VQARTMVADRQNTMFNWISSPTYTTPVLVLAIAALLMVTAR
jgi:hypothetical protein